MTDYAASTISRLIRKAQRAPVADMRERSTSAVRSSRSCPCPGACASHSVASVMDGKYAPSAGRPAAAASFSTRMHKPCFCAAARRRRMNIVISACPCDDMPLSCGPSSAVTVSSTTMRNRFWCARDSSGVPLVPSSASRASMVRAAAATSNVVVMFSRARGLVAAACTPYTDASAPTEEGSKTEVSLNGLPRCANVMRGLRDALVQGCPWCRARAWRRSGTIGGDGGRCAGQGLSFRWRWTLRSQ